MMTATTHEARVTRTIRADREKLFRAWTEPGELKHWWRMEGEGWSFAEASVDLRPGGRYRLGMTSPEGKTHVAVGEYREVQRPGRLVFTWDWEEESSRVGETLVTVEFNDAGDGCTEVVLTHERFADPERMKSHDRGWTQLLRLLEGSVISTRQVVEGYFQALKRERGWEAFLADDMVFDSFVSPPKQVTGRAEYLEATRRFYSMITGVELRELIIDGDKACALTRYELELPSGDVFRSDVAEILTVRNGKIATFGIYFDSAPFPK